VFNYHPSNKYITQHKEHITINVRGGPIEDMVLNKHFYGFEYIIEHLDGSKHRTINIKGGAGLSMKNMNCI
jgi:hypothetical protein